MFYLAFGFFPQENYYKERTPAEYAWFVKTLGILIILWHYGFLFGLNLLFTLNSFATFIWFVIIYI